MANFRGVVLDVMVFVKLRAVQKAQHSQRPSVKKF